MIDGSIIRWGVKAVGGLAANLALLTLWVEWVGLSPELAIIPNWFILAVVGYAVVNWWVFADGDQPTTARGHARRLLASEAVMLSSKGLNFCIYWGLVFVGIQYHLAWVIGAVVTFLVSYGGNRLLWHPDIDV